MAGKYEKNDWKFLRIEQFITNSSRLDIRFLVDDYDNVEDEQEEGMFEATFGLFAEELDVSILNSVVAFWRVRRSSVTFNC